MAPHKPPPPPPPPRPAPRAAPPPARPAPAPAPRPAPRAPAPRPAAAKPAGRPRAAPQTPKRAAAHPVPAARKPPVARGARPGAKPAAKKLPAHAQPKRKPVAKRVTRKPAKHENSKRMKKPAGKVAGKSLHWYQVWASEESDGGSGCNSLPIFSGRHGYSELSLDPRQPPCTASGPFNALGGLPCLTQMYIRNAHTHHGVQVPKIDNGCGSTYNSSNPSDWPSCGLYPQTVRDLGLTPGVGKHLVHIARVDGSPMNVGNGIPIAEVGSPSTPAPVTVAPQKLYFDPLEHASVTPERIDDGVDYAGTGEIVAIAACKITEVIANGSGWEGEAYIEYQIVQDGPLKDRYVYYAEGFDPVVAKGEFIEGGHTIARFRQPQPFGTEIGWAAGDGTQRSWATVYGGGHHSGDCGTAAGVSFSRLIQRLGGPGGVLHCGPTGTYPPWTPNGQIPSNVTPAPTTPSGSARGPAPSNAQALAAKYKWPNNVWSAFWELHNGMGEASAHSHSAWFFARGIKFRTTKP